MCNVSDRKRRDCEISRYRVARWLLSHYRKGKVISILEILEADRILGEEMKLIVS